MEVPELLATKIFQVPGVFQKLNYLGRIPDKVFVFEALQGGEKKYIFLQTVICGAEDFVWQAWQDMFTHAFQTAAARMKGFFGFELLTLEDASGLANFNPAAFSQLLVNHSFKLENGHSRLVKYGQCYGILQKRLPEDWGKIDFKNPVEIFRAEAKLDLHIKKIWRETARYQAGEKICLFHDLGTEPVFKFGREEQTSRLEQLLRKTKAEGILPKVYFYQPPHIFELGEQFSCGIQN